MRVHSAAPLVVHLIVVLLIVVLILVPAAVVAEEVSRPAGLNGTASVSVNAGPCVYDTVAEAMANASDGDTIVIRPGFRAEFIGKIDKDLTLRQGEAGPPGNTGCEDFGTNPADLTFDAKTFSHDVDGGMAEVLAGRTVTIRNMTWRQAFAERGGLLAVQAGTDVTLNRVVLESGTASENGGLIHALGTLLDPITLDISNSSILADGATDGNGGAIHAEWTDLSLSLSQIENNQAMMDGGGVSMDRGSLSLDRAGFINNSTFSHGGALAAGTDVSVSILDSDFEGNGAASRGGAIHFANPLSVVIGQSSRFIGNAADGEGGAIYFERFNVPGMVIDQTLFDNNIGAFGGGAIFIRGGPVDIGSQTSFVNNRSNRGGAIRLESTNRPMTINGASFQFNEAFAIGGSGGSGGAIDIDDPEHVILANLIVDQNEADARGGGIYLGDPFVGGEDMIEITNIALTDNLSGEFGGGLYVASIDSLILTDSLIQNNVALIFGGGIYTTGSHCSLHNVIIDSNSAARRGGGAYASGGENLFEDGTISDNQALTNEGLGGGALITGGSWMLRNSEISGNQAIDGGGLRIFTGEHDIVNSRIVGNSAIEDAGGIRNTFGALSIRSEFGSQPGQCDPFQLPANSYCSELTGNSAGGRGGALFLGTDSGSTTNPGESSFRDLALIGNSAGTNGSAIYANHRFGESVAYENLLIEGHGASTSTVIELRGNHSARMHASTITNNVGPVLEVVENGTNFELTNSILFNNAVGPNVAFGVPFTRSCNNSQPGTGQSMGGNLGDPGFVTTARGDYRLDASSVSADQCEDGPARDLDGLYRLSGSLFDQGAFEHDGLLVPPDLIFRDRFQ